MTAIRTYKCKFYKSGRNEYLHQQTKMAGIIYDHCNSFRKGYYKLERISI